MPQIKVWRRKAGSFTADRLAPGCSRTRGRARQAAEAVPDETSAVDVTDRRIRTLPR
jgi:hypothetical protein